MIKEGRLLVDEKKLLYPGDLLHEAGHLAMKPTEKRGCTKVDVSKNLGEEIGAICWSYAALTHLGLDPAVVFHPAGYKGSSENLIENFSQGRSPGLPLLQWLGLTLDEKNSRQQGLPPFPHMIRWLRESSLEEAPSSTEGSWSRATTVCQGLRSLESGGGAAEPMAPALCPPSRAGLAGALKMAVRPRRNLLGTVARK